MAHFRNTRLVLRTLCSAGRPLTSANKIWTSKFNLPSMKQSFPSVSSSLHTSSPTFNTHVINIQDEDDFKKQVLESSVPVVVDFHATWCGPCKLIGPRLEALVSAQGGDVILAKVDIDDLADIAMEHKVQAVPTVIGIKGGQVVDSFVGVKDDDQLKSFIKKLTGK